MARSKIYEGDIPFTETGDQLHYADPFYTRHGHIKWRSNAVFAGTLTIKSMARGRSAAYFEA